MTKKEQLTRIGLILGIITATISVIKSLSEGWTSVSQLIAQLNWILGAVSFSAAFGVVIAQVFAGVVVLIALVLFCCIYFLLILGGDLFARLRPPRPTPTYLSWGFFQDEDKTRKTYLASVGTRIGWHLEGMGELLSKLFWAIVILLGLICMVWGVIWAFRTQPLTNDPFLVFTHSSSGTSVSILEYTLERIFYNLTGAGSSVVFHSVIRMAGWATIAFLCWIIYQSIKEFVTSE